MNQSYTVNFGCFDKRDKANSTQMKVVDPSWDNVNSTQKRVVDPLWDKVNSTQRKVVYPLCHVMNFLIERR